MTSIAVVITSRASLPRIQTVLEALVERDDVRLTTILTASAVVSFYGVVNQLGLGGNVCVVPTLVTGMDPLSACLTASQGVDALGRLFDTLNPDTVVTIADRYETLATAYAAVLQGRRLVHVLAGEISGNVDDRIRHAVTQLADVHCCATRASCRRVRKNTRPELTGCPSIDLAKRAMSTPASCLILDQRGVGSPIDLQSRYVVVLQHPETTRWTDAGEHAALTLCALSGIHAPLIWCWPNADHGSDLSAKAARMWRERHPERAVRYLRDIPPLDFYRLLKGAGCLVGNSSVGIRECAYLGVPVVNIGGRQAGRERADNVRDVPFDAGAITDATLRQLEIGAYLSSDLYGDGSAGPRVAGVICGDV